MQDLLLVHFLTKLSELLGHGVAKTIVADNLRKTLATRLHEGRAKQTIDGKTLLS